MTAVSLALLAAVLYGVGAAVQHRAAHAMPAEGVGMLHLSWRLLRQGPWLVGKTADLLAIVVQALALAAGALIVVQGVVTAGVVVAVGVGALLERRRPQADEMLGALLVVAGTTVLVGVGDPHGDRLDSRTLGWIATFVVLAVAVITAVAVSRRAADTRARVRASVLLGAATGACLAVGSACLKAASLSLDRDGIGLLVVLGIVGLAMTSIVGNVLVQRAFHLGPLRNSLPALTAIEPVVAVMLGPALFHEHFASGWRAGFGLTGVGVLVVGLTVVTHHDPATDEESRHAPH
jgi:drug/metabolite transporter (DMT)-like permease